MGNGTLSHPATELSHDVIAKVILNGDLSQLNQEQRVQYVKYRCDALGLDYMTQPLDLIMMNGKLVLYAKKECSAQLSKRDNLSAIVVKEEALFDGAIYKVTARAKGADGRETDDSGCVTIKGLQGDALCNAIMKATTKAKRRAILTHCGLGMLDESELDTVHAVKEAIESKPEPAPPKKKAARKDEPKQPDNLEDYKQDEPPKEVIEAKAEVVEPPQWPTVTGKVLKVAGPRKDKNGAAFWGVLMSNGEDNWLNTYDETLYEAAKKRVGGEATAYYERAASGYKTLKGWV